MTPREPRAVRSLLWSGLESIGLSGLSFLTLIVLSRCLTPAEFGIASLALAVVQILGIPLEPGLHDALLQKRDAEDDDFHTAFVASSALGLALCALCWIFSGQFARMVGEPSAREVLQWMSLSLPATGVGSAIIAYQRRTFQFRSLAVRSLAGRLAAAVIAIVIALLGGGVWALVVQQVLMGWMSTATLWALSSFRPRLRFSRSHYVALAKFGVHSVASMLLVLSIQRVFMLMVGSRFGAEAAGYLNLAFRAVDTLRDVMAGAVSQIALPLFSRYQGNRGILLEKFGAAVVMTCGLAFPAFALFGACAKEIVAVAFGAKWSAATPYVALMALLTLHSFSRMFASPLMTSLGHPQYPIPSQIIQLGLITVGMLTFGHMSLEAAAAVWALRIVIVTPIDMVRLKRTIGVSYAEQMPGVGRTLLIAAVAALSAKAVGVAWLIDLSALPRLIAMAAAGCAVYVMLTLLFNRRLVTQLSEMARSFRQPHS